MKKISKSAYNLPVFFINSSFSLNFMKLQILNYLLGGQTMNTQTRLNQLMSFQENLKQKISNLPEGELCIYQSPSYQKWICSLPGKQKYLSKKINH